MKSLCALVALVSTAGCTSAACDTISAAQKHLSTAQVIAACGQPDDHVTPTTSADEPRDIMYYASANAHCLFFENDMARSAVDYDRTSCLSSSEH